MTACDPPRGSAAAGLVRRFAAAGRAAQWRLAGGEMREPRVDRLSRATEYGCVAEELVGPVRAHRDGVELERDLRRLGVAAQVTFLLRPLHGTHQEVHPIFHVSLDPFANGTGPAVELRGGGREEATAPEDFAPGVVEPGIAEGGQARQPAPRGQAAAD